MLSEKDHENGKLLKNQKSYKNENFKKKFLENWKFQKKTAIMQR